MLLSIIIPVYNVEAYVGKCLASVFETTASLEDFEVIVVNDGTKDGSMEVVRQFTDRPNLTVIEQENQGLSVARMKGLSVAKGDFVWFVDSDDWLVEDGVGKVLTLLGDRQNASVLMFPLQYNYEDRSKSFRDYRLEKERTASGRDIIRDLGFSVTSAQRYVIRRSLFSDSRLYFPSGCLFEDVYFSAVLITIVEQFHLLTDPVYCYQVREGSIMRTLKVRSCYDMISVHKMVMRLKKKALNSSDWPWFDRYYFRHLVFAYKRMREHFHSPAFRWFALTRGPYVWVQWRSIHSEASWKTSLKYLRAFLLPERLPALMKL